MKIEELRKIIEEALNEGRTADSIGKLELVRIKYLGRKGLIPEIMKGLKALPVSERSEMGRLANIFKNELNVILETCRNKLDSDVSDKIGKSFDLSLPGNWRRPGSIHPISNIIQESIHVFSRLGFTVADGPDIETGYYNFEALNTPLHHPSLDSQDTFWLEDNTLLRTQTSPVQIRVMENNKPPIRIITPGRCYRRDTTDATHSANFHQIEGLYVSAEQVSMAQLKGVLAYFIHEIMGADVKVRFRPHFFPFTEPSVECDFSCHMCNGKGCRVCKDSGWIEIAGAGMVDPRVFEKVGYDATKITGYAFGMGVERIAMIKYGIKDIRLLYENDARFLIQFV